MTAHLQLLILHTVSHKKNVKQKLVSMWLAPMTKIGALASIILEKCYEEQTMKVQCIILKSTKSLSWPRHKQTCWIPFCDVISSVVASENHGSTGHQYKLSNEDNDKICKFTKKQ